MPLLDLLFVRKCAVCHETISEGALCKHCKETLMSKLRLSRFCIDLDGYNVPAISLFSYDEDVVKKLIFALKREGNSDLFRFAAELYCMAVEEFSGAVTYVPRRSFNVRKYGYDHVKLPAKYMCRNKGNLQFQKLIKRCGKSSDQKCLDAEHRKINVKGAFKAAKKDIPENILIIDDVITTGSTMKECVSVLLEKNDRANICAVCLAK